MSNGGEGKLSISRHRQVAGTMVRVLGVDIRSFDSYPTRALKDMRGKWEYDRRMGEEDQWGRQLLS